MRAKNVDEIKTPAHILREVFMSEDPKKAKNIVKSSVSFFTLGTYTQKR
jgi:hypothetical protein